VAELVRENSFLTVYFPANNKALVFRVKSVYNKDYPVIDYGPLPISANTELPTFDGGSTTVPEDGVMPAMAYMDHGISFPLTGAFDETDMWYLPPEYRDRLFHIHMFIKPAWMRIEVDIPKDVMQYRFQRDKVVLGINKLWGYSRGYLEVVQLPGIHYGYRFGNDTNLNVYTKVKFVYGEYVVEIPHDPSLIFEILTRKIPSYWVTMPVTSLDPTIRVSLINTYGIDGFPVMPIDKRSEAIQVYENLLQSTKL